jgi:hypothetical protein
MKYIIIVYLIIAIVSWVWMAGKIFASFQVNWPTLAERG